MKKLAFVTGICLMALLLPVLASGAPFLTCDPHPECQEFRLFLNGTDQGIVNSKVDVETGLYVIWHDLGPLAEGSYVAEATAVNEWGESGKSAPLNFTKAIPASPLNLRVSSE